MVSFVNAITKVAVSRDVMRSEPIAQLLAGAVKNGAKVVGKKKPAAVKISTVFGEIKDIPKVIENTSAGTGKFSVVKAMSAYLGKTSRNLTAEFDRILKEAKAKGKIKIDISEIVECLKNSQGMTADAAQSRVCLLQGLNKLKTSGAVDIYIPKGAFNTDKMDSALLARLSL